MRFKPYSDYRARTNRYLPSVPSHWEGTRFKLFAEEREERSSDGNELLLSVSEYSGVSPRSTIVDEGEHLSRAESLVGYKVCHPGDLVMNIMLAWKKAQGVSDYHGIVSPAYSVYAFRRRANPRFIHYLARTQIYADYFKSFSSGVIDSRLRLYPDTFLGLKTDLPPEEEQSSIANFLDRETAKIDTLIAEQQRLIELLQEKRQSVISHAVTKGLNPVTPMKDSGVEWLGEVPEHWDIAAVGHRYSVQLGKMLDANQQTGNHSKPYLRVADVQWGEINTEDLPEMDFPPEAEARYRLKAGDLLVNEGGSYVGRSAIWSAPLGECYYQKALHRLRAYDATKDSPHFMYFLMEHATRLGVFIAGGNQTTIDHLTAEQLRRYRFAFPPMQEQKHIASYLRLKTDSLQQLTTQAESMVGVLIERRSALVSAAVTGQIDVRGLAPEASEH